MGFQFFCGIPVAVGTVLALVLGLFMTLERLEDWAAEALMHRAKREPGSDVAADGEPVWHASGKR